MSSREGRVRPEPYWNRFCSDQSDANATTLTTAVVCFILVCCCGLIKTNRSMQVELEEARRNELQKLVLENLENHPRKAGYVGNTGVEDEAMPTLELDAETLTNPVALGDYGWKMARFQVGNIGRLGAMVWQYSPLPSVQLSKSRPMHLTTRRICAWAAVCSRAGD